MKNTMMNISKEHKNKKKTTKKIRTRTSKDHNPQKRLWKKTRISNSELFFKNYEEHRNKYIRRTQEHNEHHSKDNGLHIYNKL